MRLLPYLQLPEIPHIYSYFSGYQKNGYRLSAVGFHYVSVANGFTQYNALWLTADG